MIPKYFKVLAMLAIIIVGCRGGDDSKDKNSSEQTQRSENNFDADRQFLEKWDSNLVVLSAEGGNAQVLISPKYQGKVFTSTSEGAEGKSFGWINYSAFDKEKDPHMNAYGGEDRLWLGPEGGPFSLYFEKDKEMVFDNWHTPAPIDTEEWELTSSSETTAHMSKTMELTNYAGTSLKINLERVIDMVSSEEIGQLFSMPLDDIKSVGFRTTNTLKNAGEQEWTKETGAPCMWNLDMFTPTPETVIVIPYVNEAEGKVATTDYFGEISPDRIKMENGVLFFKADGLSRGKLGIPPARVKPVAGSYSADAGVLTVTFFDISKDGIYLNQEWTTEKDPFSGDAVNAYNDGPLADGSQMGPFYEIESVSPAAFLKAGEQLVHRHSVFHFTGKKEALNSISEKVFGVSLETIQTAFSKK